MTDKIRNVLILCTGNSARSILGEAIIAKAGAGRFRSFSAGSKPAGKVNPFALELLAARGYDIAGYRSKSWDEFALDGAPAMDFVFTVCDSAAGEACPVWPGAPVRAHWGIPDPAGVAGSDDDKRAAFATAYDRLSRRVAAFLALDIDALDVDDLKRRLADIGAMAD
ncbi:MAG: arsenate reductase ArsC [Hyphomicrobiales bacterium]